MHRRRMPRALLLLLLVLSSSPCPSSAGPTLGTAGRRASEGGSASAVGLWRTTASGHTRHPSATRWSTASVSSADTSSGAKGGKACTKPPKYGSIFGLFSRNGGGGSDGCPRRAISLPPLLVRESCDASTRLSPQLCKFLFALSCVNPFVAVLLNDYHSAPWPLVRLSKDTTPAFRMIYNGVFSFLRLKPRLLFVVGSCMRALQCSTSLSRLIDPGVGVGLGLNLAALVCYARWPAPLTLGWALSKAFWTFLGAVPPAGGHVPITVHLSDPREKAEQPQRRNPFLFGLL